MRIITTLTLTHRQCSNYSHSELSHKLLTEQIGEPMWKLSTINVMCFFDYSLLPTQSDSILISHVSKKRRL